MKNIVVASHNPVKLQATLSGFVKMFPDGEFQVQAVSVPSGVPDQPTSDEETLRGAHNRTDNAARAYGVGDYWVGIEGGIQEMLGEMLAFAWVVIRSGDRIGKSRTGTFVLPPGVADLIRQGYELGDADDKIFGKNNSKQEKGAVGLLTGNVIDRMQLYEQAVVLALIPFKR